MASTGPGELARELGEQHGFEERALADALPARRVLGPDAPARLRGSGRASALRRRSREAGRQSFARQPGLHLRLEGRDGPLEGREHPVERGLGRLGLGGAGTIPRLVRIPVGPGDGKRAERARPPLDLLEPERLAKLVLGLGHAGRPGAGSGFPAAPGRVAGGLLFGLGLAAFLLGAGILCRRLLGVALRLGAQAPLERAARAVVHGPRLGRGRSHGILLGTRERRREQHAGDEHADQRDPGLRHDPARERALGLLHPLLPAAHRASLGWNRQRSRSSPIWSHPSPSTRRAT